jgi:hypothetical protein
MGGTRTRTAADTAAGIVLDAGALIALLHRALTQPRSGYFSAVLAERGSGDHSSR